MDGKSGGGREITRDAVGRLAVHWFHCLKEKKREESMKEDEVIKNQEKTPREEREKDGKSREGKRGDCTMLIDWSDKCVTVRVCVFFFS